MQARLVFNALIHQFLIPGIQIGSKVPVDKKSGDLMEPFVVSRPVYPGAGNGCLLCNQLIPGDKLQEEAMSEGETKYQRYVDDDEVIAPSVITMNALACAEAANTFLYSYLGLASPEFDLRYHLQFCQERKWVAGATRTDTQCIHCGQTEPSCFGRGPSVRLPCRLAMTTQASPD